MALPPLSIKVTADPQAAVAGLKQVDSAVSKTAGGMGKATVASGGMSGGMARLGQVSGSTRSKIQQASFQIQDIVVQLQGGTRASVALSQQLPQLAGAFGAAGAALGVGLALGIPAVAMAMNAMKGESFDLEKSLDSLAEGMDRYKEFADLASLSTAELRTRFGEASIGAGEFFGTLAAFEGERIQREIDAIAEGIAQFQNIGGDGDVRAGIADFFDVNIMMAFTAASREAMAEARSLTSEFYNQQQALIENKGNLQGQISVMQQLVATAIELAQQTDGVSASEQEYIDGLTQALAKMMEQNGELEVGGSLLAGMVASGDALTSALGGSLQNAAGLAANLWDAAAAMAAARLAPMEGAGERYVQSGGMDGATRGAREGMAKDASAALSGVIAGGAGGARVPTVSRGGGGGRSSGGGAAAVRNPAIEQLIESLKTEQEVIDEWRTVGLETLAEASAKELEAIGGANEAKLRLEEEYQSKLAAIKDAAHSDGLMSVLGAGKEVLGALGQTNEKALKMSQTFAAAEALVNSYRAAAQVLADPTIPFWGKFSAVASTVAAGIGLVNSIKSIGKSGNGGGGGASSGASSAASGGQSSQGPLDVRLTGLGMNDIVRGSDVASLFDMLNQEAGDRGLNVSFAQ